MLINNKNTFAIEYEIFWQNDLKLEKSCLWIDNKQVGYFDEPILFNLTYSSLYSLYSNFNQMDINYIENLSSLNKDDLDELKTDNKIKILNIAENYDDFIIYYYRKDDCLNFIYYLRDEPFFEYDDNNKNINYYSINISDFKTLLDEFMII